MHQINGRSQDNSDSMFWPSKLHSVGDSCRILLSHLHRTCFPQTQTRHVVPRSILMDQNKWPNKANRVGMQNTDVHVCVQSFSTLICIYIWPALGKYPQSGNQLRHQTSDSTSIATPKGLTVLDTPSLPISDLSPTWLWRQQWLVRQLISWACALLHIASFHNPLCSSNQNSPEFTGVHRILTQVLTLGDPPWNQH